MRRYGPCYQCGRTIDFEHDLCYKCEQALADCEYEGTDLDDEEIFEDEDANTNECGIKK